MREFNLFIKRLIDVFGSFIGIIFLLPLFILIAIAIKIDSKGPIIFKQDRLGKNGTIFKIFKFRTMVVNAEKEGDGLFVYNDTDNRITRVGKFLRKISFDELPQLINVLFGHMSIVGPRPPVTYFPYYFSDYTSKQKQRFIMRPGITGLAQVTIRTNAKWDDRIDIDVIYVNDFNIFLDFKIIMKTIMMVLKNKNVYPESKEKIENTKGEER